MLFDPVILRGATAVLVHWKPSASRTDQLLPSGQQEISLLHLHENPSKFIRVITQHLKAEQNTTKAPAFVMTPPLSNIYVPSIFSHALAPITEKNFMQRDLMCLL